MSKQNEIVDLELRQLFITERAIRVSKDGDDKTTVWLPLCKIDVECVRGNVVMVTLPTWLATERGLV